MHARMRAHTHTHAQMRTRTRTRTLTRTHAPTYAHKCVRVRAYVCGHVCRSADRERRGGRGLGCQAQVTQDQLSRACSAADTAFPHSIHTAQEPCQAKGMERERERASHEQLVNRLWGRRDREEERRSEGAAERRSPAARPQGTALQWNSRKLRPLTRQPHELPPASPTTPRSRPAPAPPEGPPGY